MIKRLTATLLVAATLTLPAAAADGFKVVVNADNPATEISTATLRAYFLGRVTRWSDGTVVKPVDLPEKSPVRAEFSEAVLERRVSAVRSYWLATVFAGRGTPPVELTSDEEVLAQVRSSRSTIGYVSASTALGPGVKAIPVTQ